MNSNDSTFVNDQYFYSVKNKVVDGNLVYPSLRNIVCKNNHIVLNDVCFDLKKLDLRILDNSLFSLSENEIMYILKNIIASVNYPTLLNQKVTFAYQILKFNTLDDKSKEYLYKYVDDFYKRRNVSRKYTYDGQSEELNLMIGPINYSYDNSDVNNVYDKPGATYVRDLELSYSNHALSSEGNKKDGYVRVLSNGKNIVSNDEPLLDIAGFMNATLIISLTLMSGLLLSVILFAIK